mmetsp:Transcript_47209/g.68969  ORF Transcript_47209/g.68969 Transcript_47209/m.68969 type:complete len:86 (-) Transcript_47209:339-596(-)
MELLLLFFWGESDLPSNKGGIWRATYHLRIPAGNTENARFANIEMCCSTEPQNPEYQHLGIVLDLKTRLPLPWKCLQEPNGLSCT